MKIREVFSEVEDHKTRSALEEMARTSNATEEEFVTVEFPLADTEVGVDLTAFKTAPDDAVKLIPVANASFYKGGSLWTAKKIWLKSTVAGITATFRVYRRGDK